MRDFKLAGLIWLIVLLGLITNCSPSSVNGGSSTTGSAGIGGGTTSGTVVLPLAMIISASPTTISTAGTSQITVHVVDATGNVVPDGTVVSFNLDNGLKGVLSNTAQATTGGDAIITFTAGSQSTIAVITATIGTGTVSVDVSIVGTTPATMLVSASTSSITAGNTSIITATVTDSLGHLVSGATVSFSTDPTKASLSTGQGITGANGVASVTLTGAAGPYATVDVACLGTIGSVSITISGSGSVGSIAVSSTLTSIVTGGTATITGLLRDAGGQPITGATLNLSLSNSAAGNLSAPAIVTNNAGVASVGFMAGALPTSGIVSATYAALGLTSSVNLTITAPPPANIVTTATPTSITVRGTSTITAVVTDINSNPVLDGTQVTFSVSDNSYGTLSNTVSSTSGGTGMATVTFTAANKAGAVNISCCRHYH